MSRKVMLITGAGRGIGAATARMAAARGYDLCLTYQRDRASAEAVQRDCEAAGAKVLLLQGSVEDEAHAIGAFDAVLKHFGRIDVLVNNAGGAAGEALPMPAGPIPWAPMSPALPCSAAKR